MDTAKTVAEKMRIDFSSFLGGVSGETIAKEAVSNSMIKEASTTILKKS